MAFNHYSFIAGSMCQSGDRYLRSGYKETALTVPEVIRKMGEHKLATGVELHHRGNEDAQALESIVKALEETGLQVTFLNAWTYGERQWQYGSLSAADAGVRKAAVARCKSTIDTARFLKANGVSLWLGQDGFDYVFQTDYMAQWSYLVESMKELCDYADGMPIAVEPKPREPRNRSLIDNVQTALLLRKDCGRENLGITVDTGHVIAGMQGLGASLTMAIRENALYNMHTNDNYGAWDDDMIVGSVRLNEMLETFYLLKKYHYQGYISVDIFPYREDAVEAVEESILCMKDYDRIIERWGVENIDELIAKGDVPQTLKAMREAAFGK